MYMLQHFTSTITTTIAPIAPKQRPLYLSTLHNGWVRQQCSFASYLRGPPAPADPFARRRMKSFPLTLYSWIYRENRVPHYQREFQKHDGLRLWEKVRVVLDKP